MSNVSTPEIECDRHHTALAVRDLGAAVEFYTQKLRFTLAFTWGDPPTFAGVNLGRAQIFLTQGTPNPNGCTLMFAVGDADELHALHREAGVEILQAPADRDYGIRDYAVRDLNGYVLQFGHDLLNVGPPVPIQRVDVPLRLEKRLAALLYDLAEHKHKSLNSCVEEIFLHTNEPLGDGVASPHTRGTLRYIQELKKKHGIDYDSHASYRFVEVS